MNACWPMGDEGEVQNVQYMSLKEVAALSPAVLSLHYPSPLYGDMAAHLISQVGVKTHLQMMKQQDRGNLSSQMTTSSRTAMLTFRRPVETSNCELEHPEHPFGVCQQCKTWPLFSQPFSELSLQWACSRDKVISSLKQKAGLFSSL